MSPPTYMKLMVHNSLMQLSMVIRLLACRLLVLANQIEVAKFNILQIRLRVTHRISKGAKA